MQNRTILLPITNSIKPPSGVLTGIQDKLLLNSDHLILLACYQSPAKHVPIVMGGDFEASFQKLNLECQLACHKILDDLASGKL
jgi:hypothetical protein